MYSFPKLFSYLRSTIVCTCTVAAVVGCGDRSDAKQSSLDDSAQSTAPGTQGKDHAPKRILGAECEVSEQCMSGNCRAFSIAPEPNKPNPKVEGKSCSTCNSNADCTDPAVGNLCVPTYSDEESTILHFVCGKGELGDGCVDNTNCGEGRVCAGTILGFSSCGECVTSADCTNPAKPECVISYAKNGEKSHRSCGVKLADGKTCSTRPSADDECINYCAVMKLPFIPESIGVCSPCKDASHCEAGQTCKGPLIDVSDPKGSIKLSPATCEPSQG